MKDKIIREIQIMEKTIEKIDNNKFIL